MANSKFVIATSLIMGLLSGCSSNLPFYITIEKTDRIEDCVLPLGNIAESVAVQYEILKPTLRETQILFETELGKQVRGLNCKRADLSHFRFGDIASKWMTRYSSNPADPAYSFNRLREIISSAITMKDIEKYQAKPDENRESSILMLEDFRDLSSAWCGDPQANQCVERRSLFKSLPEPGKLFEESLKNMIFAVQNEGLHNESIMLLGYEIPWDKGRTSIRYGVTFYFRQVSPMRKEYISENSFPYELLGYDMLYANEATPRPFIELGTDGTPKRSKEGPSLWQEHPWRFTGYPFSLVIGLKNAAFEIAKLPFSLVAGAFFGRGQPTSYAIQVLHNAYKSLYVELTRQTINGAEEGVYRLLTEVPIVGQLLYYNHYRLYSEPDILPTEPRRKIFLSRGIYGGNKWEQDTGLWAAATHSAYPSYDVYAPPYRYGTVTDVVWSMLNLSHGPAYDEADYVMEHAGRHDRIYLAGHSGGVQRSAVASRILGYHGYMVKKIFGIAGPAIGPVFVDERYREPFKVYLNTGSGNDQDLVSKGGFLAVRLFSNATVIELDQKSSTRHRTPLRSSFAEGLIFDGFVRDEFMAEFREDVERPGRGSVDNPDAIPWRRD